MFSFLRREIEKANSAIFDALLTIFDEGILNDARGRMIDFRNTIIIMTSNLGVETENSIGFSEQSHQNFESSIRSFFRPEFYNRIDMLLIFHSLCKKAIRQITLKELNDIRKRQGLIQKGMRLDFSESLISFLSQEGFDIHYGARPLQRTIEKFVVAPLAHYFLKHKDLANQTIQIDYQNNEVKISIEK